MPNFTTTLFVVAFLVTFLPTVSAFGAGDIPDFSYLNDKAFRHGDIENVLSRVAKTAGQAGQAGGLIGFAQAVLSGGSGAKFDRGDIKKVYFGNWLRDYSQAMDIAGLSKLSADTLLLVVSVLGFMTFGFSTNEFEVTADRLGVYLPTEHIDNPKGYAEKEGDARRFHPKLRGPVNPQELEIDQRTGMKKYIASEGQSWDTSTALIRRTFRECIERGRRAGGSEGPELWETYRLLGTGLHTMEDLLAHSNWCELALRKMGHREVFCHVGDRVIVNTPNGPAPPLVTGTFGSSDFLHSLMGEATDKLSQASVTELTNKMNESAGLDPGQAIKTLKGLLSKLPIGGSQNKMDQGEQLQAQSQAYHFNPDNVAPPEVQKQLSALLKWRDDVYRDILAKIEMVPGLADLLENLTNALNAYVYTVLAPWLGPILAQATEALTEGSKAVIDNDDQYEVFNNDRASDPSHSLLSKDHFALILNEPAGKVAQLVVENTVNLIVKAWSDNSNPDQVIDQVLEAFHHPYYANGRSQIQNAMYEEMGKWLGGLGPSNEQKTIQALTKESVRAGKNKRFDSNDDVMKESGYSVAAGPFGTSSVQGGAGSMKQSTGGYGGGSQGGNKGYGQGGYGGSNQGGGSYDSGRQSYSNEGSGYSSTRPGQHQGGYGSTQGYSGPKNSDFGRSEETDSRGSGYGGSGYRTSTQTGFSGSTQSQYGDSGYGSNKPAGYGGSSESRYGDQGGYGRRDDDDGRHGRGNRNDDDNEHGSGTSHKAHRSHRDSNNDDADYRPGHESRHEPSRSYNLRNQEESGGRYHDQTRSHEHGGNSGAFGQDSRGSGAGYGGSSQGRHGGSAETGYGSGYGGQSTGGFGGTSDGGYGGSAGGYGSSTRNDNRGSSRGGEYGESRGNYGGSAPGGYGSSTGPGYGDSAGGGYGGSSGYGRSSGGDYGGGNTYGGSGGGGSSGGGYAPSYITDQSSGYGGGNSDTFGAERLNIGDNDHEGRHGHHKGHRERNEYGNY